MTAAALLEEIYSQDRNFSSQIEPWCLPRLVVNAELTQNFVRNLRNQQTVTVCYLRHLQLTYKHMHGLWLHADCNK